MSVPKKSLIGSRPTEKKATTKPETAIGEAKAVTATAKALRMRVAKQSSLRRMALKGGKL